MLTQISRFFYAPDSAPGVSGEPSESPPASQPPTPSPAKLFTQDEVNQIVQARVRKIQFDASSSKTLQEQNAQLLQQNKELTQRLTDEQSRREQAEKAKTVQTRDSVLKTVLTQAGCTDIKAAERYLLHDLTQNIDGEWCFRTESGGFLPITVESAQQLLPDSLKKPVSQGGSGAGGGRLNRATRDHEIDQAEAKLKAAEKQARASGGSAEVAEYRIQKRKFEELKRLRSYGSR